MKRGATPLALPLGELSPKVTERAFSLFSLSVFASLNRLSQRERQEMQFMIPLRLLIV